MNVDITFFYCKLKARSCKLEPMVADIFFPVSKSFFFSLTFKKTDSRIVYHPKKNSDLIQTFYEIHRIDCSK